MYKKYQFNNEYKIRSKLLRKSPTDAERLLWSKLRMKQLDALKFYRQFAIDRYILDFYCPAKKLAIELDGSQHIHNKHYDLSRSNKLEVYGITVLRFWDNEVLQQTDSVLEKIYQYVTADNS